MVRERHIVRGLRLQSNVSSRSPSEMLRDLRSYAISGHPDLTAQWGSVPFYKETV